MSNTIVQETTEIPQRWYDDETNKRAERLYEKLGRHDYPNQSTVFNLHCSDYWLICYEKTKEDCFLLELRESRNFIKERQLQSCAKANKYMDWVEMNFAEWVEKKALAVTQYKEKLSELDLLFRDDLSFDSKLKEAN
jgi:hypothetical protein